MSTTYYPRPEILTRPGLQRGHAVIEASAGTGKTFTLEHLVLDLIISSRAKIEQILVVTFTDAATRELRERVRALLRKVCDEGFLVVPEGSADAYWEVNSATRSLLREALFRFDGAAISTIHGFCQSILSEQAFLGGRLFKQEHADGAEMFGFSFREEARLALAESGPVGDALRRWVEGGSTLKSLQELLYRSHREGCPDRCPITPLWDPQGFRRAAAMLPGIEALKADIEALFTDKTTRKGYVRLFDRLFDTISQIQSAASEQAAVSLFLEWAEKDCVINAQKRVQIEHLSWAADMGSAPDLIKRLAAGVRELALLAASDLSFFVCELLPRVQTRLAARKRSLGLIDYDDMLLGVRETLTGPGAGALLETLRRRWKYALVDEFQDTDPVQWEIFRRIFVDGTSEHHLVVIGDPKQAIYGFRGADVHTYHLATACLHTEYGALRLPLKDNFRSTGAMIDAVNAILTAEDAGGRSFFGGMNCYSEQVCCGDPSRTAVEGGEPSAPVHLVHFCGGGERFTAASVKREMASFIAGEILRLADPQTGLLVGRGGGAPAQLRLSDIYILTRTGREGQEIGEVLRRYGIAYAFYKQDGLFQTDEACAIHRLLCAIDAPTDPAWRMPAWLTPFFGVRLEDLAAWRGVEENHPLAARLLKWKQLAAAQQWTRLFDHILAGSGLIRRLIFSQGERALTNYLHLFELLLAEAHARPVTLRDLARGLKARIDGRKAPEGREGELQRLETDKDSVQILTMHKAKGLEAEVVFIGGGFGSPGGHGFKMEIYHHANRRCMHLGKAYAEIAEAIEREKREEEQRLAYVALTRARSRLYLPYFGPAINRDAPEGKSCGLSRIGPFYGALQKQLDLLWKNGCFDNQHLFLLREAGCLARPPRGRGAQIGLEGWPGERLLEAVPSRVKEAEKLESGHRGILLTSYTRMKRGIGWQPPAAEEDERTALRAEEIEGEASATEIELDGLPDALPDGLAELPGGATVGTFLHTLLEETAPTEVASLRFEDWSLLPAVMIRAAATARRHGIHQDYLPCALRMVYHALRTPLYVQSREESAVLDMPDGIASALRRIAELAFTCPIPEKFHPLIAGGGEAAPSGPGRLPYQAVRGYLQGMIDLLFEHKGKVYMLDWKSDRLPSFDRFSLNAHIEANYALQAKVYLLAVVRLIGIRSADEYESRFGGILYIFLRGIRPGEASCPDTGIWFSRPPWHEVAAWEQEFLYCKDWGGKVIELEEAAGEGTAQ